MSVHQLKDGRWIVRHEVGKDPERPDKNKRYFGRGVEAEALARAFDRTLHKGRAGEGAQAISLPFVRLVNEYMEAQKMSMTAAGWPAAVNKMRQTILPLIGGLMALDITPAKLDWYASEREQDGVKRTTIHREISDIRAVLRWAVKRKLIAANPMEGYEMPKRDDARLSPPTDAEFNAILTAAAPHLKRAMLIAYHTGLRPGREELYCLRWDAVDFHARTLMVMSAQKGGMPRRMVPLNAVIYEYLQLWYNEDAKQGKVGYIIHYNGGKVDSLKTSWRRAKIRAKVLRRIRLYDIRHAFATKLLAAGANLKAVSEILGHASPEMTMYVYQHVSDDLRRQAVDLMTVGAGLPQEIDSKPQ